MPLLRTTISYKRPFANFSMALSLLSRLPAEIIRWRLSRFSITEAECVELQRSDLAYRPELCNRSKTIKRFIGQQNEHSAMARCTSKSITGSSITSLQGTFCCIVLIVLSLLLCRSLAARWLLFFCSFAAIYLRGCPSKFRHIHRHQRCLLD